MDDDRVHSRMPPLRALAVFEATARNMSFSRAAVELNVTPAAVSQQIKVLEGYLSARLFRRLNRRVLLTEAGELYYSSISSAFSNMATATERIGSAVVPTILTIRSAPSFATKWLLPRLPEFLAEVPNIDVRLDASNEKTDFTRENVDLEIRFGDGSWRGLHVEPLCRDIAIPLASPTLSRRYAIRSAEDLSSGVPLIHSIKCPVSWERWFAAHQVQQHDSLRGPRFDRSFMAIEAASMGLGVVLDCEILAQRELASGDLVCPVEPRCTFAQTVHWLVTPHQSLERVKTRRFRDWLLGHPDLAGHRSELTPDNRP